MRVVPEARLVGLEETGGWGQRDAQAHNMVHSTAPAALGPGSSF